jgi:maltokinase
VDAATASLPLADGVTLTLTPSGDGRWACGIETGGRAGAAELLVAKLRDGRALAHPGFRLQRDAIPPAAAGERPIDADQTNESVVVGERIVVKWLRQVADAAHPAPATLAHLAAVSYRGIPQSYGALLWRAPSGREVPCCTVSAYLPGARDGYQWCVELATEAIARGEREGGTGRGSGAGDDDDWVASFPARLGRLTAGLHAALATPSGVVPEPVAVADEARVRSWHEAARRLLERVLAVAPELDSAPAGPGGGPPPVAPSAELAAVRKRLARALDLLADAGTPAVQRVHGDLHVGQVLRWRGGLAVVDFDGDPFEARFAPEGADPAVQPAARDVAHLLVSLDQVGRIVDRLHGFAVTDAVDAWSARARGQALQAYVAELAFLRRSDVFDQRLLAPFVAEQVLRDVLYAVEHLPRWAYAVTGGADLLLRRAG